MSKISDTYINALLADATYALDSETKDGITGSLLETELDTRMTPTLAKYISDNFTMVTHIDKGEYIESGFDATVWKDAGGKTYVSMTGSEGIADFISADIDLSIGGVAKRQVRDMVNWWLKNTTPEGENTIQLGFEFGQYTSSSPVQGTGLLSNVDNVTVNGHSLGGHLATAFGRIFGQQWQVDHIHTYNSAGYTAASSIFFDQIQNILGSDVGLGRYPNGNEQTNFFAQNGINITTRTFLNGQAGLRTPLFNEEGTGLPNHFMYKLTDALALGNLIESIDNTFDIEKMNSLFELGSNQMESSLEHILDSLRHLILGDAITDTPIGDSGDSLASRVQYHQNLAQLKATLFDNPNNLSLVLKPQYQNLQIVDANSLADSAKEDTVDGFAYRYALKNLNPFAITGNVNLYSQHNNNGELNIDKFTDQYLQDRADMLAVKNQLFAQDESTEFNSSNGHRLLNDLTSGIILRQTIGHLGDAVRQKIAFGTDNAEISGELDGGIKDDHLYGGGGFDIIHGNKGNDYIEGNSGDDILYGDEGSDTLIGGAGGDNLHGGASGITADILDGGQGHDIYHIETSDGDTIIRDSDLDGEIKYDGIILGSTNIKAVVDGGNIYQDDDKNKWGCPR